MPSPPPGAPRSASARRRGRSWCAASPRSWERDPSPIMASAIERYLEELREELRHDPLLARRLCEEVADHLAEIAASERSRGMSEPDAEEAAVRRFGAPGAFVRQFDHFSRPLKALL